MTVKEYMKLRGIRQTSIVEATGLDSTRVSLAVRKANQVPLHWQRAVAKFLGISVQELKANCIPAHPGVTGPSL